MKKRKISFMTSGKTKGKAWYILIFESSAKRVKNVVTVTGGGSKLVDANVYKMCKVGDWFVDDETKKRAK